MYDKGTVVFSAPGGRKEKAGPKVCRIAVIYYSLFGLTQKIAEDIALLTDADIFPLVPEKEYSFDYNTASKAIRAEISRGFCPKLKNGVPNIGPYGSVFIGSPNWFRMFAPPVLTVLRNADFTGRTVVPFCSHGGGGMGNIEINIQKECRNSVFLPGRAFDGSYSLEEIGGWLRAIGIKCQS